MWHLMMKFVHYIHLSVTKNGKFNKNKKSLCLEGASGMKEYNLLEIVYGKGFITKQTFSQRVQWNTVKTDIKTDLVKYCLSVQLD